MKQLTATHFPVMAYITGCKIIGRSANQLQRELEEEPDMPLSIHDEIFVREELTGLAKTTVNRFILSLLFFIVDRTSDGAH